jgi:hypothetical protein
MCYGRDDFCLGFLLWPKRKMNQGEGVVEMHGRVRGVWLSGVKFLRNPGVAFYKRVAVYHGRVNGRSWRDVS